ncbi:MAG TPA: flagellar motor protein MotB [Acidimicrobiia bacterium]|jgi:chemotaxis protein MotB|nr:flagellar motor protein MotB [Acidimicrobiia bacterium]
MSHGGDDGIPEEHEEHVNHEAWVIPYADLLTLLMAMFIALFAMSTVDVTKFKAFAIGFHEALGGGKLDAGVGGTANATSTNVGRGSGNGALDGTTLMPNPATNQSQLQQILAAVAGNKAQASVQRQTLADVQKQIDDAAKKLGFAGDVHTKQLNNGLQVTLLTDKVLFQSGHAELQAEGLTLLSVIGEVLKSVDNTIDINGYTDNIPIGPGGQFPSNLYLSSFRANRVADYFASIGLARSRLFPAGRGDQDFIATNATPEGRAQNRRVEIIVESKLVKQTLDQAGLDSKAAPPTTLPIAPLGGSPGASPNINPNLGGH